MPEEMLLEEIYELIPRLSRAKKLIEPFKNSGIHQRISDTLMLIKKTLEEFAVFYGQPKPSDFPSLLETTEELHWAQILIIQLEEAISNRDFDELRAIANRCEEEYLMEYDDEGEYE